MRTHHSQLRLDRSSELDPLSCSGDSPRLHFATLLMPGYLLSFMRVSNRNQVRLPFDTFFRSVDLPCRSLGAAELWCEHCGRA